jgi:quercetin dioxygenase-like cupin family protein
MRDTCLSTKAISMSGMLLLGSCVHGSHAPAGLDSHSSAHLTACEPANGRQGQLGCWVLASAPIGPSAAPLYWHVYEVSSANEDHAVLPPGKLLHAFGRNWLVAVAGEGWKSPVGRHVASVGPLKLMSARPHTASFMEATFTPGMSSRIHTHPGPEAWVVLEGEQCLETSEGVIRGRAGNAMMVRGGIPMQLFGTGTATRKALVLIIHPTGEALGATYADWRPTGSCLTE